MSIAVEVAYGEPSCSIRRRRRDRATKRPIASAQQDAEARARGGDQVEVPVAIEVAGRKRDRLEERYAGHRRAEPPVPAPEAGGDEAALHVQGDQVRPFVTIEIRDRDGKQRRGGRGHRWAERPIPEAEVR